ncbi:hypothetical protein AX16_005820 [Volvariella volvacea WC 439]|nr:hypothetical protein AX16_005820 [Volvariella volvacea WC 439]
MPAIAVVLVWLFLLGSGTYVALVAHTKKANKMLPPGPPRRPIIGNLLDFPKKWPHYRFTEWAREYGDIFSLKIMSQTIIVLNSPTAVFEVIDRKSTSSNRPASIIADIIVPNNENIGTARYADETWKTLRKAAMMMLKPDNLERYRPAQRAEATHLMLDMVLNPEGFYDDISRLTTSFFLAIIYGHRAPRSSCYEAKTFTQVQLDFMYVLEMGKLPPVDIFPVLNWVPDKWAGWKQQVLDVKRRQEELFGHLVSMVRKRVDGGVENGSFMEEAYKNQKQWGLSDSMLRNLGGTLLEGSDTSSGILQGIILLLVAYPEVQKRAQEEMDAVVGTHRTPTWEDLDDLPYLRALVQESFRFRPVGPLAIPHAMAKDEVINGMLFPKDSALFMNLWAIFHDPRYFDEPEVFKPERYLKHPLGVRTDVPDDPARRDNMLFGAGRRVCPGVKLGRGGIEINAANFIWAFNFTPARDPVTKGIVQPDIWAYTEGVNATPLPFKCTITPRSEEKVNIIKREFLAQAVHLAPYEINLSKADEEYIRTLRASVAASLN